LAEEIGDGDIDSITGADTWLYAAGESDARCALGSRFANGDEQRANLVVYGCTVRRDLIYTEYRFMHILIAFKVMKHGVL
jgi:hypothetical protein